MFLELAWFEGAVDMFDLAQQQVKEDYRHFSLHTHTNNVICDHL